MQLASRLNNVKETITLALGAKAKEMKAQGFDVINLSVGEPDFDTPNNIKEAAIRALNSVFTKYTPVSGIPELKEAIIKKFKDENNLEYKKENIIVTCGAKHALYNIMQAILNPDDEVIIVSPYWVTYPAQVMLAGGKPVILETLPENEYKITPSNLEKLITNKTKAIILNSPNNPTGSVYTKNELTEISTILKNKDIFVISDDIYERLIYNEEKFYNLPMIDQYFFDKTIIVNGVSKTYAMTGWRIGYAAGPKHIISAMNTIQGQSTSGTTSFAQKGSVEAILGNQDSVSHMRIEYKKRRDLAYDLIKKIPGIKIFEKPEGAFFLFIDVREVLNKTKIKTTLELANHILEKFYVVTVPGKDFGMEGFMRISYATSEKNIIEGMKRIEESIC
jgi:aspartate aminotransferase